MYGDLSEKCPWCKEDVDVGEVGAMGEPNFDMNLTGGDSCPACGKPIVLKWDYKLVKCELD